MQKISKTGVIYDKLNSEILNRKSSYARVKSEYLRVFKKLSKSDFSNSPVVLKQELEVLENLKIKAFAEGIKDECDWIYDRIAEINNILLEQSKKSDYDILSAMANYNTVNVHKTGANQSEAELKTDDLSEVSKKFPKLSEYEVHQAATFFKTDFEDKQLVEDCFKKLMEIVDPYTAIRILNKLSVTGTDDKKVISKDSVDIVCTFKKCLQHSRTNEIKERKSPLNNFHEDEMEKIIKNIFSNEASLAEKQKAYEDYVRELEESLLFEFIDRFTDKNGEINNNYLRTAIVLRNSGIVYSELLKLIEYCTDEKGNVDTEKVADVSQLKKAGVLSKNIKQLLLSCKKDENGQISKSDINNCINLTMAYIPANQIKELLPVIRNNNELKELFITMAGIIPDKSIISSLAKIMKSQSGEINGDSVEIMYNLLEGYPKELNSDFINEIYSLAKGTKTEVSESAPAICAAMVYNGEPSQNLIKAFSLCSDKDGNLDETLSDILWVLATKKTYFDLTEKLLQSCKMKDGNINHKKAEYINKQLQAGESPMDVINLFLS